MISKTAYPNYSEYGLETTPFDLKRWTQALRDIYVKVRLGLSKTAAKETITKDWPQKEKFNFNNWMKYYESGEMSKYKTAQYYVNEEERYFLPNPPSRQQVPSPIRSINEIAQEADHIANRAIPGLSKADEEAANDEFRRKLISRLNSIEKHLGTQQGFLFAGKEYENLLKSIHDLKRKIHTHGKITLSAQTCVDLLIREAGKLKRKNCLVAADVMVKLAQQNPGNGPAGGGAIPDAGSLPQGLGNLDTPAPNLGGPPPGIEDDAPMSGIDGFLENLEGGGLTDGDELEVDDGPKDEVVIDEDEVQVEAFLNIEDELVVEGQGALPAALEKVPRRKPIAPQQPKPELPEAEEKIPPSDFDTLVNSAFDKLTIEDLLAKLQDINLIFKKKEINNQLAIVSLMLNKLQLTPYFDNFSEVQQKNLDNLNYSSTRLDDIISTLQGGIGKSTIDLSKQENPDDPEAQLLKRHLENEEQKDKEKKETRKQVEEQKMNRDISEKPELEVESPGEIEPRPQPRPRQPRPQALPPGV